jgi:hypothetical protein
MTDTEKKMAKIQALQWKPVVRIEAFEETMEEGHFELYFSDGTKIGANVEAIEVA